METDKSKCSLTPHRMSCSRREQIAKHFLTCPVLSTVCVCKKDVACPTRRCLWKTLHLHFYVLTSLSVFLLTIVVTVPPGIDNLQLDLKSTLTNFLFLGRVQHNFQTTLAQLSCMVYSNICRPRKDTEKLKVQMEIMAWSQTDCGLKHCIFGSSLQPET